MFLTKTVIGMVAAVLTTAAVAETHTVRIVYNNFMPNYLTVQVGDEVEWLHQTTIIHRITTFNEDLPNENAHVPFGGEAFRSDFLLNGSSFTHTFTSPGLYKYVCPIHPHEMFGYIEVVQN